MVLSSSKCAHTAVVFSDSPPFKVSDVYVQKYVPGVRGMKPYLELGFNISSLNKGVTLDSVFCAVGKPLQIDKAGFRKVRLGNSSEINNGELPKKAFFYYSHKKHNYYYVVNNIIQKKPIILP